MDRSWIVRGSLLKDACLLLTCCCDLAEMYLKPSVDSNIQQGYSKDPRRMVGARCYSPTGKAVSPTKKTVVAHRVVFTRCKQRTFTILVMDKGVLGYYPSLKLYLRSNP